MCKMITSISRKTQKEPMKHMIGNPCKCDNFRFDETNGRLDWMIVTAILCYPV